MRFTTSSAALKAIAINDLTVVNHLSEEVHHSHSSRLACILSGQEKDRLLMTELDIQIPPFRCPFTTWTPACGRVLEGLFAYDTETTAIDDEHPENIPSLVLATACDGDRGLFIARRDLPAFFEAHAGQTLIGHNLAFDLKVTQRVLGPSRDLYALVEQGRLWDTQILKRLHSLATAGHTARRESSLDDCVRTHLGIGLPKNIRDDDARDVRTSFGRFLGLSVDQVPEVYLRYAAGDAVVTWHLFAELNRLIKGVLTSAQRVWGYIDENWLRDSVRRHGPLTHHIQLRASIVLDAVNANGIAIDAERRTEKLERIRVAKADCRERMRRRGFLVGEPGSAKALQSRLREFARQHPGIEIPMTESGERYSTAADDLTELASYDPFFSDYSQYRAAEKLESTYLGKMARPRHYPRFGYLLETGRTYCGGGLNLQNLPKELGHSEAAATIRGAFVPGSDDLVFIDADYGQIELVTFAHVCRQQFGLPSRLADRINSGEDIHRLIAGTVLGKDIAEVTKAERDSAKPVSFGRPGGMGAATLQQIARVNYLAELSLEEVEERIGAYHTLCPELDAYLDDEVDTHLALAEALHLTPGRYGEALGQTLFKADPDADRPQGWLGGMLLKVVRDPEPSTQKGRSYTRAEIDFFWDQVQQLDLRLKPTVRAMLDDRKADPRLWRAIRDKVGRRPVITLTGRLRANATFCSSRNCLFQGLAADGAIYGLWLVWRAGHKIVSFIHDQVVVESPADDQTRTRANQIEELMRQGMTEVVPGMFVKVETEFTRSLNKKDRDPRYTGAAGGSSVSASVTSDLTLQTGLLHSGIEKSSETRPAASVAVVVT